MKKQSFLTNAMISFFLFLMACQPKPGGNEKDGYFTISKEQLRDKIKGAWALQTIGVTFGGPTEFDYRQRMIPDSVTLAWTDTSMYHWMTRIPGLYDDIYMDLTFVDVLEKKGMDAPARSFAEAYAHADYWLWHANQQGRYNILNGIMPPQSGNWLNNPHADDIDFQIESDFAGIMNPGMPQSAADICDRVGHIMNSGDGYYGGVFISSMYSNAYMMNNVADIVEKSLQMIPAQSTYHQCISDVVTWYRQYPNDWKKTWQLVEDKWGHDIGCPDGVGVPFNIDSKINSAFVVIGLLYGNGDLDKTLDISTRCGQDSDCNPSSAGGIVGAMIGYDAIPEKWGAGLPAVEDLDFKYTTVSLNDVYDLSYRHALAMIERNGGKIEGDQIKIHVQDAEPVPLEQNFTGYTLSKSQEIDKVIKSGDPQEFNFSFNGAGIVLRGKVGNLLRKDDYALEGPDETLDDYKLDTEFYIDGQLVKTSPQPLAFKERNPELFFAYELPSGDHELKMKILNPNPNAYLQIFNALIYNK